MAASLASPGHRKVDQTALLSQPAEAVRILPQQIAMQQT